MSKLSSPSCGIHCCISKLLLKIEISICSWTLELHSLCAHTSAYLDHILMLSEFRSSLRDRRHDLCSFAEGLNAVVRGRAILAS